MGTLRNSVHLIGRPGMDPEIKKFGENRKLAKFTLATNEKHYNDNMELVQETEWHNIVLWRNLAEWGEKYIRKSMKLYVEGKLQTRSWEKEGIRKQKTEIIAENVQILWRPDQPQNNPETVQPAVEEDPYLDVQA